jgi:hypothetical protein
MRLEADRVRRLHLLEVSHTAFRREQVPFERGNSVLAGLFMDF